MNMKLYAIRDLKADSFAALHPCANDQVAKRSFLEACADVRNGDLAKYPEDYQLYQVGEWEPNTGSLSGLPVPKFVASALEVLEQARAAREKFEPRLPLGDSNKEVKA